MSKEISFFSQCFCIFFGACAAENTDEDAQTAFWVREGGARVWGEYESDRDMR